MKKCKKCGQPKQLIKVSDCGFKICLCDWDMQKAFSGCTVLDCDKNSQSINKLKNLILINIGYIYSIKELNNKNREELIDRLQKIYRILMNLNI